MNNEIIHILVALYDKDGTYSSKVGVMLASVFEHTESKIHLHLITDKTLTDDNKNKIKYLCNRYSHEISYYFVEVPEKVKLIPSIRKRLSPGTLYRLFICEILPKEIKRIIYLDTDILCFLDIKHLWEEDITDYSIGVVLNGVVYDKNFELCKNKIIDENKYFNAGIMLIDVNRIRERYSNLLDLSFDFLLKYEEWVHSGDQDALNFIFQDDAKLLERKYNWIPLKNGMIDAYSLSSAELEGKIIHFAFVNKAWNINTENNFLPLYLDWLKKTPWFDTHLINLVFKKIINYSNGLKEEYTEVLNYRTNFMQRFFESSRCYIWGSGEFSERLLKVIESNFKSNKNNLCYIDKNKNFWNTKKNNMQVISTDIIKEKNQDDFVVIIGTDRYEKEIIAELVSEGFIKNKNYFLGTEIMDNISYKFKSYPSL